MYVYRFIAQCLVPRQVAAGRKRPILGGPERLESRSLLSVAPIEFNFAASPDPGLELGELPAVEVGESFPLLPDFDPRPSQPPLTLPGGRPTDLPEPEITPPAPPGKGDDSDAGGLIEIGGFDKPDDADTFGNTTPQQEVRDVLKMLSMLAYRPDLADTDDALTGVTEELAISDAAAAINAGKLLRSAASTADGGLVTIEPGEITSRVSSPQPSESESLLEISVHMDRSQGKYQVFEVLTSESPVAVPELPEAYIPSQLSTSDLGDEQGPGLPDKFPAEEAGYRIREIRAATEAMGTEATGTEAIRVELPPQDASRASLGSNQQAGDIVGSRSLMTTVALIAVIVGLPAIAAHRHNRNWWQLKLVRLFDRSRQRIVRMRIV